MSWVQQMASISHNYLKDPKIQAFSNVSIYIQNEKKEEDYNISNKDTYPH